MYNPPPICCTTLLFVCLSVCYRSAIQAHGEHKTADRCYCRIYCISGKTETWLFGRKSWSGSETVVCCILTVSLICRIATFNPLQPSGHYMYHQFNIQQFYVLPTQCICVFCVDLRTNSDLCHLQHKLIGFYNPDEKCLQRGTDWVFK